MAQQMAIYDQGCKLMVGVPFHFRTNGITFLDRMQVRVFTAVDDRCMTWISNSREVCSQ